MTILRQFANRHATLFLLTLVLVLGLGLRLYHLGFQSLWLDEIHTAIESDPAFRDQSLWDYLRHVDQQPPLFFLLERLSVFFLGNNETSLRLVSALSGTAAIGAMYLLGKELQNKRLGLLAALLMAINAFCISYSQEARPYALALLFSILSWLFFVRLVRTLSVRNALLHAGASLLLLYSNYFGMFIVLAQVIIGLIIWIYASDKRFFFRAFLLAAAIISAGFAPLLYFLQTIIGIKVSWIPLPAEDIGISYFFEYFGNSDLLKPILLVLLISFFIRLVAGLQAEDHNKDIRARPMALVFTLCSVWIFVCLFIPFLRSYLVVPMMVSRYTIMIIPAYILLLVFGIDGFASQVVRGILITVFCLLSLTHLIIVNDYYNKVRNTQFRELAEFVAADTSLNFPVLTYRSAWHQSYYLRKLGYRGTVIDDPQGLKRDSLVAKNSPFWQTDAHGGGALDAQTFATPSGDYSVGKQIKLLDARGQLFVPKNYFADSALIGNAYNFPPDKRFGESATDQSIPIYWDQKLQIVSGTLKAGRYRCYVLARGTRALGQYPHIRCYINSQEIGSYYLSSLPGHVKAFDFILSTRGWTTMSIAFDNDVTDQKTSEDRNVFIQSVFIQRIGSQ